MATQNIDTGAMAAIARKRNQDGQYLFGHFEADFYGERRRFALMAHSYANLMALAIEVHSVAPDFGDDAWTCFTDITKNIPELEFMRKDRVVVKTSDGNECLRAPLLSTGLFVDTGSRIRHGWAEYEVWQLTDKFVGGFNEVHASASVESHDQAPAAAA